MKIDAHQHFWKYDLENFGWINDDMKAIQKSFLPEDLKPILDYHEIDGCVLVQVNQTSQETDWFLELAEKHSFIKGVVGWIDILSDEISNNLNLYENSRKLKGFRHIVQAESVGFMRQDKFISGIKQLADFNYTYDILIYPNQLKDAIYLVKNCPNNRFVLDHIAKPNIKESKISQWSNYIQKLSEMPNVYCKVSGLVTEANWQNWQKEDFFIYLDTIFNCFGVDRILYGSDWPVCLVAASYESQLEIYTSYFDKLSGAEKDKIFGKNAVQFYSL